MSEAAATASYLREEAPGEGSEYREGKIVGQGKRAWDQEMGLTEEGLRILLRVYENMEEVGARLLELGETVAAPKEGYIAVYEWQVRKGLTFLIGELLRDNIMEYQLSVSQIYLLGICRIIAFEMCCGKAGVTGSVKLFRYFY